MTKYDEINELCEKNNGIVTFSMVEENNIPSWYLSDMVHKGRLIRVARGIYTTHGGDYDEYMFFQIRNKKCIYSFESALYLQGMTDRVPFKKEVTVYKGYNSTHISDGTIVHYAKKEIYELGITECDTLFGNTVRVYDREKTLCDLIASRNKVDVEIFSKALKFYANNTNRDYKKLRSYAKDMHIAAKVDEILEIV